MPLVARDSCPISPTDLVGGWNNKVQIVGDGLSGTWNGAVRPSFSVKATDMCGVFSFTFPDDAVFRGELSEDKSQITFSQDNIWTRTVQVSLPPTLSSEPMELVVIDFNGNQYMIG